MNSTINYYNENAAEYANTTLGIDMSRLWELFEKHLPKDTHILDLGCGSGRDTKHFLMQGYIVTAVDGAQKLCEEAEKNTGHPVKCMMFQDIDYVDEFDGIWACSSLLHLNKKEVVDIMHSIFRALKSGGIFFTCFKYGDEEYDDEKGRHFSSYTENTVMDIFEKVSDQCAEVNVWVTGDNLGGRDVKWVNVIAAKL